MKHQVFTKNIPSKSSRTAEELWRISNESQAGRGSIAGGCCGAGGFINSQMPSSSSVVVGLLADPTSSSQGNRKMFTG